MRGGLPVPPGLDPQTRKFLEDLKEKSDVGEGQRGDPLGRYLKVSDLLDLGLAKLIGKNAQRIVSGGNLQPSIPVPNQAIPPAPTGFTVIGGFSHIFLQWDDPLQMYGNHSYTLIYRNTTDNIANAVAIAQVAAASLYADLNVSYGTVYYYWIRFVSTSNIQGPFNSSVGTSGQISENPAELLARLQNKITESELFEDLNERINLIDTSGTGLVDRVNDLETVFGDTATAAASASAAIAAQTAAEIAAGNADAAAVAAATSQSIATSQATAASTSASLAAGYTNDAEAAATASQTSATNAATSASNASTSATTASSAATSAAGSSASAGSSATAAATSATNAGNSATAAAGSATSASTSATNAGNSATAAQVARVAAESARDDAQGSATAAATSASTASTAASSAGTSASAANTSATTASTAASDALTYRNQAATSATTAEGHAEAAAVDYAAVNARLDNAGGTGVTVEQKLIATASSVNGLYGQYSVKIDNNGLVTGFGLSSETVNGKTNSFFLVNADTFGIVNSGEAKVVSSLTRSGTTATANCTAHGLQAGDKFSLSNVHEPGWSGTWTVASVPNSNSFTFTVPSTLTTPANARIKLSGVALSSLTRSSTTATATLLSGTNLFNIGEVVDVSSVNETGWNGQWTVTGVTSTTVTFTVPNTLTTPATSSIKMAAQTIPFVVDLGKVVMDGAFIKNATVNSAQVGTIVVDKISGINSSFVLTTIGTGNITNSYIGSFIQSTGYAAGVDGWHINKSGFAEFQDIIARGDIEATSIKAGTVNIIDSLMIQDYAVAVPIYAIASSSIGDSSDTTWQKFLNVSIQSVGKPIAIFWGIQLVIDSSGRVEIGVSTTDPDITSPIFVSHAAVYDFTLKDNDTGANISGSFLDIAPPPNSGGTFTTYYLLARPMSAGGGATIAQHRYMSATYFKK